MIEKFYKLAYDPFIDERAQVNFYASHMHQTAIDHLIYGINERKGIILLTGDCGAGKTTICKQLIKNCSTEINAQLILNPDPNGLSLLKHICLGYGIQDECHNKYDAIEKINQYLLTESSNNKNVVLVIDNAETLGSTQLEQIRLLSNLETEKQKLLQIILCGQVDLYDKLKQTNLRQIDQRILLRYYTSGMQRQDIKEYIFQKIRSARTDQTLAYFPVFTDDAIDVIFRTTDGIPRKINLLTSHMLFTACALELFTLDASIAHQSKEKVLVN